MASHGKTVAVSAPRGGLITLWDVASRVFFGTVDLRDGCGVAPAGLAGGFVATSGAGGTVRFTAAGGITERIDTPAVRDRHWDNHLVAAALPS